MQLPIHIRLNSPEVGVMGSCEPPDCWEPNSVTAVSALSCLAISSPAYCISMCYNKTQKGSRRMHLAAGTHKTTLQLSLRHLRLCTAGFHTGTLSLGCNGVRENTLTNQYCFFYSEAWEASDSQSFSAGSDASVSRLASLSLTQHQGELPLPASLPPCLPPTSCVSLQL